MVRTSPASCTAVQTGEMYLLDPQNPRDGQSRACRIVVRLQDGQSQCWGPLEMRMTMRRAYVSDEALVALGLFSNGGAHGVDRASR